MQPIEDLSGLSEYEFEARRSKIISDYIKSLPEDRRKKAYVFQLELDLKRIKMEPQAFMAHCFSEVGQNLERTSELFQVVQAKMGFAPPLSSYTGELKIKD